MVLGWFFVHPCPYPEHIEGTATENGGREEQCDDETTQLIRKSDHDKPPNITGMALMGTVDFWILFWFVSLCECLFQKSPAANQSTQVIGSGVMCE